VMLGSDKSRGYYLEMICADFLAGANLDQRDPEILLKSVARLYKFLPSEHKHRLLTRLAGANCMIFPLSQTASDSA